LLNVEESAESEVDYNLLAQMFCRTEEEIKAEEAARKQQALSQTQTQT